MKCYFSKEKTTLKIKRMHKHWSLSFISQETLLHKPLLTMRQDVTALIKNTFFKFQNNDNSKILQRKRRNLG